MRINFISFLSLSITASIVGFLGTLAGIPLWGIVIAAFLLGIGWPWPTVEFTGKK